jgi:hypothetical protein
MASSSTVYGLESLLGSRFTLLDSIRDAGFLGQGSGNDYGQGVLDNALFFFTTNYEPTNPSAARPYPVKFMWIGSPLGTNDATDTFNIYVADVNPDNFAPGVAPSTNQATSWLVNPRLVLSVAQAKSDVINWFDANYPGGATGGVGNSNTGSNTTYGTLAGGTSAVGNISGVNSIDGQFWPIYDYVDNTVLLYFSFKTPNCNTLSIYCYKLTDTEFSSPATSNEFLGGLYAPGWTPVNPFFSANADVLSSHRFSICSPDPLAVQPRIKGLQNGVFMYSYGVIDGVTPDHGRAVSGSIITDLHTSPLSPGIVTQTQSTSFTNIGEQYFTPDKLGSIFAANAVAAPMPGYACIYNTPMMIDRRYTKSSPPPGYSSSGVYISAMQLRVMYYNPESGIGFGSEPIRMTQTPQVLGTCRAQFTDLPDGKTKIIYANFSWDQYLNLAYEYVRTDVLSPSKQRKIQFTGDGKESNSRVFYTYGKKKMHLRTVIWPVKRGLADSNSLSAIQNTFQIVGAGNADPSNGAPFGMPPYIGSKYFTVSRALGASSGWSNAMPVTEVTIEDLDAYVFVNSLGPGTAAWIEAAVFDE